MNEMVQMAQERHKQLAQSIAKREAEIESFREEAEKLDAFLDLASELFGRDAAPEQPAAPRAAQPAQSAQPAIAPTPAPEAQRPMPARQQARTA